MYQSLLKRGIVAFVLFFSILCIPTAQAVDIPTSVSLSTNKLTPGFGLQFTVHAQPNIRQNVNRSAAMAIPTDWLVEIAKNDQYPAGVWGVHRVLFPLTDMSVDNNLIYTMTVPNEVGWYKMTIKNGIGDEYASEVFEVSREPFVTVTPPRSFEQGETIPLRIYSAAGEPWNINTWGNQAGQYNIDVYYFGNGGPITHAKADGSVQRRVERVGEGVYHIPASAVIAEYYVGLNTGGFTDLHSTSFDVVASSAPAPVIPVPTITPEPVLPPVLEPYESEDETENNPVDDTPAPAQVVPEQTTTQSPTPTATQTKTFTCPLDIGKAYKSSRSNAVYFVVEPRMRNGAIDTSATRCTRRAFTTSAGFFSYFTSWNEVIVDNRIDQITTDVLGFMPKGPKYDPKYGALVKTVSDPKVYLLLGGKKYWINSEQVFTRLRYSWNWVEDVSEELLASYDVGGEIVDTTRHPNFTLVKYSGDNKVYRLEPDPNDSTRTVKRHIADEYTFTRLGYRWDRVVTIDAEEQYPDGTMLQERRVIRLEP